MMSEFPLFCFTTLAGLAAGCYTIAAVFLLGRGSRRAWLLPLVCLALLALGMLGLPAHLGRPERLLGALAQPSAMIAQEAYWSAAFGVVLAIDLVLSKTGRAVPRALRALGAAFGVVLACVMANAYFVSLAVAAWTSWTTFPLFVVGDLAMGAALAFALAPAMPPAPSQPAVAGLLLLGRGSASFAVRAALAGLAALSFLAEALQFSAVGLSPAPFVLAAVLALAGLAVEAGVHKNKLPKSRAVWPVFACLFFAVALARFAFYAVCSF